MDVTPYQDPPEAIDTGGYLHTNTCISLSLYIYIEKTPDKERFSCSNIMNLVALYYVTIFLKQYCSLQIMNLVILL